MNNNNSYRMSKQKPLTVWFMLIGWMSVVVCIDQKCNSGSCPANSACLSNNYCGCNSGFIGNCNTEATVINSNSQTSNLIKNMTTFYEVIPTELQHYIEFTFQICNQQNNSISLTLTLWGEVGNNTVYTNATAIGDPNTITFNSGCSDVYTTYIQFESQPNGQPEALILGIYDNSPNSVITISVNQRIVIGVKVYYYITIGLIVLVVIGFIIGLIACFYEKKRRRERATNQVNDSQPPEYNNIQHFEVFMPAKPVSTLKPEERSLCPICLQQLEEADVYRKTPCNHHFHSICIDSWCLKHLTCPVCRTDLTYIVMNEPRKSRLSEIVSADGGYLKDYQWEQSSVVEGQVVNGQHFDRSYTIRESML